MPNSLPPLEKATQNNLLLAVKFQLPTVTAFYATIFQDNGWNINFWNEEGDTLLHIASKIGHFGIVSILLDKGANLAIRDGEDETFADFYLLATKRELESTWKSLADDISKLLTKGVVVGDEIQTIFTELTSKLTSNWNKLSQNNKERHCLISQKGELEAIHNSINQELQVDLSPFTADLRTLTDHLQALPYSSSKIIDSVCKIINKLLEKLANFFMNGPIVTEGVYIPIPKPKSYNFNFFHPAKSACNRIESLLTVLKPSF